MSYDRVVSSKTMAFKKMHGLGSEVGFSCQIRSLCKKTAEARSFADASEQNTSSKWNGKGTGPIPGKSTDLMWVG